MSARESDLHSGHRQRLKKRFLEEGLDRFELHNAIELLLFFGIPRRDTNPLAHELLDTFGSFSAVFDAPYEELIKLKGMTESAATLIKLCIGISRLYDIDKTANAVILDSTRAISEFIRPYFKGKAKEELYAIYLDNNCKILTCKRMSEGGLNSAPISPRKIVEGAIACNASNVIMAHNHPQGMSVPSNADCVATHDIYKALQACEIRLLDHVIVSPDNTTSMLESHYYIP